MTRRAGFKFQVSGFKFQVSGFKLNTNYSNLSLISTFFATSYLNANVLTRCIGFYSKVLPQQARQAYHAGLPQGPKGQNVFCLGAGSCYNAIASSVTLD